MASQALGDEGARPASDEGVNRYVAVDPAGVQPAIVAGIVTLLVEKYVGKALNEKLVHLIKKQLASLTNPA